MTAPPLDPIQTALQVVGWVLSHPADVALIMAVAGLVRVEGTKLVEAVKAKSWDKVDDVLVEFMTEATTLALSNPERKAWVLQQTLKVAQQAGIDKKIGLTSAEDLGRRMESLWTTVVRPQVLAGETDSTVVPPPEAVLQPEMIRLPEDATALASIKSDASGTKVVVGPVSVELPLKLPF